MSEIFPDLIWLKIFSFLNLRERYKLSLVSRLHSDIFKTASLWEKLEVIIYDSHLTFKHNPHLRNSKKKYLRIDQYEKIVIIFGYHLKKLSINLFGTFSLHEKPEWLNLMQLIPKYCNNVSYLKISVPENQNFDTPVLYQISTYLGDLISILSFKLESFLLDSWPILKNNHEISFLNKLPPSILHLSLFHPQINLYTWARLNSFLPNGDQIIFSMNKLTNLTSLSLHSASLSLSLLKLLSSLSSTSSSFSSSPLLFPNLKTLNILLTYDRSSKSFYSHPSSVWLSLFEAHPHLKIGITIGNTIPPSDLYKFFNIIVTHLNSLIITHYSRYPSEFLFYLSHLLASDDQNREEMKTEVDEKLKKDDVNEDASEQNKEEKNKRKQTSNSRNKIKIPMKQKNNLEVFKDFSSSSSDSIHLLHFVSSFPFLNHFVFYGKLDYHEVFTLAKLRKWQIFKINIDEIVIDYNENKFSKNSLLSSMANNDNDDKVIIREESGILRQISLNVNNGFYWTEESENFKRQKIDQLEEELNKILSCPWKPFRFEKEDGSI